MSRGVLLRRAGPADAGALAELEQAASQHPWSEALVRAELERAGPDAVLVLEGSQGLLGYGAYRIVLDELHVMNVAVRREARRQGLGRLLLEAMLRCGRRAGVRRALLEVRAGNQAARSLYSQCGFAVLAERRGYYAEPPDDALVLVREDDARRR